MPRLVITDQKGIKHALSVQKGSNLRKELLKAGLSPYTELTGKLNCKGNGLCATCGVIISEAPKAKHWHDQLAMRFSYPRLSCQINVEKDLTIELPKKLIWGSRIKRNKS